MKIVLLLVSLFYACRAKRYVQPFHPWGFHHGFGQWHFGYPLQNIQYFPRPFFKIHIYHGLGGVNFNQRPAFIDGGVRRFGGRRDLRDEGTLGLGRGQFDDDERDTFDDLGNIFETDDLRRGTEDITRRGFDNRGIQAGFGGSQIFDTRQAGNRRLDNSRRSGNERGRLRDDDDDDDSDSDDDDDRFRDKNAVQIGLGDIRRRKLDRLAENGENMFRDLRETDTFRRDRSLGFSKIANNRNDNNEQDIFSMGSNFRGKAFSHPVSSIRQETTNYIADLSKGMTDMILTLEKDNANNGDTFGQKMNSTGQSNRQGLDPSSQGLVSIIDNLSNNGNEEVGGTLQNNLNLNIRKLDSVAGNNLSGQDSGINSHSSSQNWNSSNWYQVDSGGERRRISLNMADGSHGAGTDASSVQNIYGQDMKKKGDNITIAG